jgi:hypothetical protein
MNGSSFVRFKSLSIFMLALAAASLAACSEKLDAGNGCPLLCPQESAPLLDTIVEGVVVDTSATGFPIIGYEMSLFLAHRGDTLDTRVIARYDSLPLTYTYKGIDSTIERVDSAYLLAPRPVADTAVAFAANGRIEAYDVTDAANDTSVASLGGQMTAANKIGELAYAHGESPDTLKILLDTARVRSRVVGSRNLRIGLRMVSASSDLIRIVPVNGGGGIGLTIVPNSDTSAARIKFNPITYSPEEPPYLRAALSDFQISVVGNAPAANTLRVGGSPAHRVMLQFDIPSRIIDSSVIVRATLMLTQRPSGSADAGSAVGVQVVPIVASEEVKDLHTQLEFAGSNALYPTDSLTTIPKDSGVVTLEMVRLLRAWKGQDVKKTPRLAALYLSSEATRVASFDFFSREAPAAVRPRLRITYVTRVNTGQP